MIASKIQYQRYWKKVMKKHQDPPETMYKKNYDEAKEICRGLSV